MVTVLYEVAYPQEGFGDQTPFLWIYKPEICK